MYISKQMDWKEQTEPQGTLGMYDDMNVIRALEEEEKADQAKKAREKIILKTSQIWEKIYTYRVKKLNKSQAGETQRNPHQDTAS